MGLGSFLKSVGKGIGKVFKAVGSAVKSVFKGIVNTVKGAFKGDIKSIIMLGLMVYGAYNFVTNWGAGAAQSGTQAAAESLVGIDAAGGAAFAPAGEALVGIDAAGGAAFAAGEGSGLSAGAGLDTTSGLAGAGSGASAPQASYAAQGGQTAGGVTPAAQGGTSSFNALGVPEGAEMMTGAAPGNMPALGVPEGSALVTSPASQMATQGTIQPGFLEQAAGNVSDFVSGANDMVRHAGSRIADTLGIGGETGAGAGAGAGTGGGGFTEWLKGIPGDPIGSTGQAFDYLTKNAGRGYLAANLLGAMTAPDPGEEYEQMLRARGEYAHGDGSYLNLDRLRPSGRSLTDEERANAGWSPPAYRARRGRSRWTRNA